MKPPRRRHWHHPLPPAADTANATAVEALLDLLDDAPHSSPQSAPQAVPRPQKEAEAAAAPLPAEATRDVSNTPSGEHFMAWLRHSIQTRKLIINDAKALVHTVDGTAYLVSPGVFQRYAQEHLQVAVLAKQDKLPDWQWAQKQFEKLSLHRKQTNGLNIWTCEVTGPRKSRRLHGYLLTSPDPLFHEVLPDNPYLHLRDNDATQTDTAAPVVHDDITA